VNVAKTHPVYAAGFSDVIHSFWERVFQPDALTEVRTFKCPTIRDSMCTFGIMFDFVGECPEDDLYKVAISGESGTPAQRKIFPPPIAHRTYTFVVERTE